jgi:ubiquinone/menaquinone biosynthesis C-methylase UbiE
MNSPRSKKAYKGLGMEGFTARWYASLTRKSLDQFTRLAHRVAKDVPRGSRILEVAPGPGYFATELARLNHCHVAGIDISRSFVEIARRNAAQAGVDIDLRVGDAANMPFQNESFDFLLCRAAFKNFSNPLGALREMHRVLKPGGRALIIDLRKDSTREEIREMVEDLRLTGVNKLLTRLIFRFMLLKRAYTKSDFERMISQTKFEPDGVKESPGGLELSLRRAA